MSRRGYAKRILSTVFGGSGIVVVDGFIATSIEHPLMELSIVSLYFQSNFGDWSNDGDWSDFGDMIFAPIRNS